MRTTMETPPVTPKQQNTEGNYCLRQLKCYYSVLLTLFIEGKFHEFNDQQSSPEALSTSQYRSKIVLTKLQLCNDNRESNENEPPITPPGTPRAETGISSLEVHPIDLTGPQSGTHLSQLRNAKSTVVFHFRLLPQSEAREERLGPGHPHEFNKSNILGLVGCTHDTSIRIEIPLPRRVVDQHQLPTDVQKNGKDNISLPTKLFFCCSQYSLCYIDKDPFTRFVDFVANARSPAHSGQLNPSQVNHIIELFPDSNSMPAMTPSRIFACFNPDLDYQEVSLAFFELYKSQRGAEFKVRCCFTCQKHRKRYDLLRFDHAETIISGWGLKEPESNRLQQAKEKKMVLVRKISYDPNKIAC